jgi:hypothetical protein
VKSWAGNSVALAAEAGAAATGVALRGASDGRDFR